MVKFGADQVFKSEDSNITDDDIDVIIGRGEHRTEETQKKLKDECQHDLATFSMEAAEKKVQSHDSHGFFDSILENHAQADPGSNAKVAKMHAAMAVDISAEQAGLTGREAEFFELIRAERDLVSRVPWMGPKDTIEARVDLAERFQGAIVPAAEVPNGTVHPQAGHLGVTHTGWSGISGLQWKRLRELATQLGFHASTTGTRTLTVTALLVSNWPMIRTALMLLQVNEQTHLPRTSRRTADSDDNMGASRAAVIKDVGKAIHSVGNFAYMWGIVDWTDPTHTKTTKLNWPTPIYMAPSIQVAKVACGLRHTVIVATNGKAFTMGHGSRSVLGHTAAFSYTPLPVRFPTRAAEPKFTDVACGQYHSLLLATSGEVWSFGAAVDDQLGRHYRLYNDEEGGETVTKQEASSRKTRGEKYGARPGVINGLKDITIVQVACGPTCSFAVSNKGKVYSWGFSADGMLGLAEQATSSRAVLISRADRPTLIAKLTNKNIVKVSVGLRHMLALDQVGQVYACGFGGYGRLGLKDTRDRFEPELVQTMAHIPCRDIEAAAEHCLGLSNTGDVFWWGRDGQKTDGTRIPQPVDGLGGMGVVQLAAGRGLNFARTSTGDVWVWGQAMNKECFGLGPHTNNLIHSPAKVVGLSNCKVVNIASGDLHTVCICDGKTSSSETCHACGDGGSLIMCDTCPLAFHYDCLPECIAPEDLPPGDWSCAQCAALSAQKRLRSNVGKSGSFEDVVELVDHATPTEFELSISVDTKYPDLEYRLKTDARRIQVLAEKGFAERRKELSAYRHNLDVQETERLRVTEAQHKRQKLIEEHEAVVVRNTLLDTVQGSQRKQWEYMTRYHQTQEKQLRHEQQLLEVTANLELLRMQLTFDNDVADVEGASAFPFVDESSKATAQPTSKELEDQKNKRRTQIAAKWEKLAKDQIHEREQLTETQKRAQEHFKTLTLAQLKELHAKQVAQQAAKAQAEQQQRAQAEHEQRVQQAEQQQRAQAEQQKRQQALMEQQRAQQEQQQRAYAEQQRAQMSGQQSAPQDDAHGAEYSQMQADVHTPQAGAAYVSDTQASDIEERSRTDGDVCHACQVYKDKDAFSVSQWRKLQSRRRCKVCLDQLLAMPPQAASSRDGAPDAQGLGAGGGQRSHPSDASAPGADAEQGRMAVDPVDPQSQAKQQEVRRLCPPPPFFSYELVPHFRLYEVVSVIR